ncbi:MAG: NTP transferase domain-containing protein [Armatimonadetes bacterium]|nr:NTP transferase domain-containing protein [Armatimonadota bacterium]
MGNSSNGGLLGIVAAGGFGTRCGLGYPKSLFAVEGESLLSKTIAELRRIGAEVIVLTNRSEYWDLTRKQVRAYSGVRLALSGEVESTVELLRCVPVEDILERKVLFCYGHAPRPAGHLRDLIQLQGPAVSVVRYSSKRKLVRSCTGLYMEPPYYLPQLQLHDLQSNTWSELIDGLDRPAEEVLLNGPGEANYSSEIELYAKYASQSIR